MHWISRHRISRATEASQLQLLGSPDTGSPRYVHWSCVTSRFAQDWSWWSVSTINVHKLRSLIQRRMQNHKSARKGTSLSGFSPHRQLVCLMKEPQEQHSYYYYHNNNNIISEASTHLQKQANCNCWPLIAKPPACSSDGKICGMETHLSAVRHCRQIASGNQQPMYLQQPLCPSPPLWDARQVHTHPDLCQSSRHAHTEDTLRTHW